jgi:hypothetical protein
MTPLAVLRAASAVYCGCSGVWWLGASASATRALTSWSWSWWVHEAGVSAGKVEVEVLCTHRVRTTLSTPVAKYISRRRGRVSQPGLSSP